MTDIRKQLLENQLWETVAFAAKAAFLFLLTPVMLRIWGPVGYGEFAVASSLVVFVSMFDLGLRGRARVELCLAFSRGDHVQEGQILTRAILRFVVIAVVVFLIVLSIAFAGLYSRLLGLPAKQDHLITITVALTQLQMFSGFFLEPFYAGGRIGIAKMAGAAGAIAAILAVWLVLQLGGGVTHAIAAWLGCLSAANLLALLITRHFSRVFRWPWMETVRSGWGGATSSGIWFNVTNAAWLAKNHGITFLVSALSGPAVAGTFFIILRLSEIIGSFGAISSDVTLGGMATNDPNQRRRVFSTAYAYAAVLCMALSVGIGVLTPAFWVFWLKTNAPFGLATGWLAGLLGIGSAFNRIIVFAAMSLGIVRSAAIWTLIEAGLAITGVFFFQRYFGMQITLLFLAGSSIVLAPVAWRISQALEQTFWQTWRPIPERRTA